MVRTVFTALRALFSYLVVRRQDIGVDPTDGLRLPEGSNPRERVVPPAEMRVLIAALDESDQPVFATAHGLVCAGRRSPTSDCAKLIWSPRSG